MYIDRFFREIKSLISNDKLEEVLNHLDSVFEKSDFGSEILSLQGRLKDLEKRNRLGVIDDNTYSFERNKIRRSIVTISEEIKATYKRKNVELRKESLKSFLFKFFLWSIIISILAGFAFLFYSIIPIMDFSKKVKKNDVEYNPDSTFVIRHFSGNDDNGKSAEYIIYLVRGYNWSLGEVSKTEKHNTKINICDHVETVGVTNRINNDELKSIICFGNASYEENLDIPKETRLKIEEDRALVRAKTLANCISPVLQKLTPVYLLNLGKNTKKTELSEYQRQIIVVGLLKNELGVIHEEALYNGLRNEFLKGNLEFDILNYSKIIETGSLELVKYF